MISSLGHIQADYLMRSHQKGSRSPLSLGGAWHCHRHSQQIQSSLDYLITYRILCRPCHVGSHACNPRRHRLGRILPPSTDTARVSIGLGTCKHSQLRGTNLRTTNWAGIPRLRLPVRHRQGLRPLQRQLTRSYWHRTRAGRIPCDILDHVRQTGQALEPGQFKTTHGQIHQRWDESAPR